MCHQLVILFHNNEAPKLNTTTQLCGKERASMTFRRRYISGLSDSERFITCQGAQTSSEKTPI